jgi:hypothetical protein
MLEICIQISYDQNIQLILKSYLPVVYGTPLKLFKGNQIWDECVAALYKYEYHESMDTNWKNVIILASTFYK